MSFFNSTPLGRIINRCTKDTSGEQYFAVAPHLSVRVYASVLKLHVYVLQRGCSDSLSRSARDSTTASLIESSTMSQFDRISFAAPADVDRYLMGFATM